MCLEFLLCMLRYWNLKYQPFTWTRYWAIKIWTTCHFHPMLSYWNLNNLSLASHTELLQFEQPVICVPCWAIEQPATCIHAELLKSEQPVPCTHAELLKSEQPVTCNHAGLLNNLLLAPMLGYRTTCHLHPCWAIEQPVPCTYAELLKSEQPVTCIPCWGVEIWITCYLHSMPSNWKLSNLSLTSYMHSY